MSDTSLLFNFLRGRDTASPHMRKVAQNTATMAGAVKIASIASVAATAAVAAGFASLAAQGVALVAAVSPIVGLLAYLPALATAAVAGIVPLVMAFSGLGTALKRTAGGAGASSQAIEAAERRIEMAQRAAVQAQRDLNAAREAAAENLRDMALALARARLDEEAATLGVADAQRSLRQARAGGDRNEIIRANLAYRESVQTLEEVKERLGDVTEESEKATSAGVEGSDDVQSALQRQADAVRDLADAQKAATSGGGGADKAAEAYAKLSMAGKQLVDVLRAIAPSWRTVQQAVQQATFAGVAQDVRQLSDAYLPTMRNQLAAIGVGWNMAFRGTAQLAATPGFVNDTNSALTNTAVLWQRVGSSFAPFLSGFRHFMVVGSSFLPLLGGWILSIARRFDDWAAAARASGRAHDWIANALTVLSQVWQVAVNLGGAIAAIFRAGDAGPAWLPGLVDGTAKLRDFLSSTEGQQKMGAVFATLRDVGSQLWQVITNLGPALLNLFSASGPVNDTMSVFGTLVGFAADHIDLLAKALPVIIGLYIAYKAAMAGAIVVEAIRLPILLVQTASNFALAAAMRANTAAMLGNEVAQKRGLVTMAATKVAMVATAIWTGIVTAAQWLWNIAMMANPIGLIILAIIVLVGVFVLLWMKSEGFRNFFIGLWEHIWSFLKMIGAWFAGPFVDFFVGAWNWIKNAGLSVWNWLASIPGMLVSVFKTVTRAIASPFISAFNFIADAWNNTIGRLSWTVPSWVPFIGGNTISVPKLPHIQLNLAEGGLVHARPGGVLANIAEGGEDEVVTPLSKLPGLLGGRGSQTIRLEIMVSGPAEMKKLIRKIVRDDGGGDVQVAFGG